MKLKFNPCNRVTLLLIILLPGACQTDEPVATKHFNQELMSSAVVADALLVFKKNNGSLLAIADFMNSQYAIDFNSAYETLSPHFNPSPSGDHVILSSDISMGAVDAILLNMGAGKSSPSYDYLQKVSNLFEGGLLSEEEILSELGKLKIDIFQNGEINDAEREKLVTVATLVHQNFAGLVDIVTSGDKYNSIRRTQGWFNKVWRVVRSVVVTPALGAIVGVLSTDGEGNVVVNAVVGAAIGGVAAIVDAAANDHCHFALQCSGGWRQNCSSGECEPYIR